MSLDELAYLKHMLDEARYLDGKAAGLDQLTEPQAIRDISFS